MFTNIRQLDGHGPPGWARHWGGRPPGMRGRALPTTKPRFYLPAPAAAPAAMSIKEMPLATRPREKLLAHGAHALADVELLALLLRTGRAGLGVLQRAERLLARFDGLAGL